MQTKRLTKSRFKIGAECPTKLYYQDRKNQYGNKKQHDEFLKALADGGFQVGELAKLYYPGGHEIKTLDYEQALKETDQLLQQKDVIIYEAALGIDNLFIRVDILIKKGDFIELIEVKAKSFDSTKEFEPFDKRSLKAGNYKLNDKYKGYLLDVAFQTYVARKAKPRYTFQPFLMMADKSRKATVDQLNQMFLIAPNQGRTQVTVKNAQRDLGERLLERVELSEVVDKIINECEHDYSGTFENLVKHLSAVMASSSRMLTPTGAQCKNCEFRIDTATYPAPAKSGFEECWTHERGLKAEDLQKELVLDVWDFRGSQKALERDKIFAADLTDADLNMKAREDGKSGYSRTERQLLQIEFARTGRSLPEIDTEGLAAELKSYEYPLHFIDFETTTVAIPFHAGRRPYEQMAFQFSHHVMHADGRFEHKTEYLDDRLGVFPNFDFVRALRRALGDEGGTVFRFAAHENTVLNQIRTQLLDSDEADRFELVKWIESLTTPPDRAEGEWEATRQFVDMRDLTVRFYYLPETRGSNSIKKVLPAVLNAASPRVLEPFAEWIVRDGEGRVRDPYKLLPPLFSDVDPVEMERVEQWLVERDELNDGGAAMVAWSRMQFSEMSLVERAGLREGLLRYCRLDTLAMVMVYKWWMDVCGLLVEEGAA